MTISTTDARALFTQKLIAVYKERVAPMSFLRSFFTVKEESTLELSIEVQRGTERIAVDVERGTEGNRNQFSRSTEKIFVPPLYKEYFDATQLSLYDRLFGSESIDAGVFNAFLEQVAEKLMQLQDMIERAYELQCAQVLQTGIVTLNGGVNIDFKRKAASMLNLSTINANRYWNVANTSTPIEDLLTGARFLRNVGKSQGGTINGIFGGNALQALLKNAELTSRADIRNYKLDDVRGPQKNATGASLHGQITVGEFSLNLWSYPEVYDKFTAPSTYTTTPYIDENKVILLPETPKFVLGFGAVPQLVTDGGVRKGAYIVDDYKDARKKTHDFEMSSAGVAIPVAVDQIYTVQVLA